MYDYQKNKAVALLNFHLQQINPNLETIQHCRTLIEVLNLDTSTTGRCDYPWQIDSCGSLCGLRSALTRPGGRLVGKGLFGVYFHFR